MAIKSLHARKEDLSLPEKQLEMLSNSIFESGELPTFAKKNKRNRSVSFKA
jgi:hypothetical protein